MTNLTNIGLAVIGPGAIAESHLDAFVEVGGVQPIWAVGRSASRTSAFAQRWGIPESSTRIEDALGDERVQVVLICSPNDLHAPQAQASLEAGKHVIAEIPIGMSSAEAEELVDLATTRERKLYACHTMRSFSGIRHMRDLIVSGMDSITQVQGYFAIPRRNNEGFSGTRTWIDDLLWHHACHLVDATLWITASDVIDDVWLLEGDPHPDFGMTMDLTLAFTCVSSVTGQRVIASHALTYQASNLAWQMRFAGKHADYCFDTGRLTSSEATGYVQEGSIRDLRAQNVQILDGLRTGKGTDFDARSVLPAMRALDLLQQAGRPA